VEFDSGHIANNKNKVEATTITCFPIRFIFVSFIILDFSMGPIPPLDVLSDIRGPEEDSSMELRLNLSDENQRTLVISTPWNKISFATYTITIKRASPVKRRISPCDIKLRK
jgi:hypothetical protein